MLELTITLVGLTVFFCLFLQILLTILGMMSLQDASFFISRQLVVCDSLDDSGDPDNANAVADRLVLDTFQNSSIVSNADAYVTMADTGTGDDWEKGNFATLHLRGTPAGLFEFPYLTIEYTFMIEGGD